MLLSGTALYGRGLEAAGRTRGGDRRARLRQPQRRTHGVRPRTLSAQPRPLLPRGRAGDARGLAAPDPGRSQTSGFLLRLSRAAEPDGASPIARCTCSPGSRRTARRPWRRSSRPAARVCRSGFAPRSPRFPARTGTANASRAGPGDWRAPPRAGHRLRRDGLLRRACVARVALAPHPTITCRSPAARSARDCRWRSVPRSPVPIARW